MSYISLCRANQALSNGIRLKFNNQNFLTEKNRKKKISQNFAFFEGVNDVIPLANHMEGFRP